MVRFIILWHDTPTDPEAFDHFGCGLSDEWREHGVERVDFVVEFEHPAGKRLERETIRAAERIERILHDQATMPERPADGDGTP